MSGRAQYVYATVSDGGSPPWPAQFYAYVNSDQIALVRVTTFASGGNTYYFPELVIEGFTGVGTNPTLYATGIGNGTSTAVACQEQIQAWCRNGGTDV